MDEYDEPLFYPNAKSIETQREDIENDFFLTFKYPENFDFKNNQDIGRSIVEFTLFRNGEIENLTINTEFAQKNNNKFIPYFNDEIRKFATKTKWHPRKQRGIKLNAGLSLWISHSKPNIKP